MEASGVSSKRPACDNCKGRKRVLISPRYDEAIESVDRSLKEVSQAVQQLLEINQQKSNSSPLISPTSFIGNHSPDISGLSEGYRGESSFKAHVHRVTDALKDAAADLESTLGDDSALSATVQMIDQATGSEESSPTHIGNSPLTVQAQHPELEGRSLPSTERVLKLIRLCQTEKQRFFIDVPVIDEQEFGEYCQKVCFAITDFSTVDWIIFNAGLFFLLQGLKRHHYALIDINESDIEAYSQLLKANLEAAIQSLRLCSDPSIQACQALAVLAKVHLHGSSYRPRRGCASTSVGIDYLAMSQSSQKGDKCFGMFMSTTKAWLLQWAGHRRFIPMMSPLSGRPFPKTAFRVCQYSKASLLAFPRNWYADGTFSLYSGFVEYAFIVGDMHAELFSASALRQPLETRSQNAKSVVSKLLEVNTRNKQSIGHNPPDDDLYQALAVLLDFMMYGLVTIAYRVIPCDEASDSPLKCSNECTEAARSALRTIVRAFKSWGHLRITGWTMLLNMMFSLVPFASFVVLAGHTVAMASEEDLTLLCSAVSAIEPTSISSPSAKKLYDVCKTFYELASFAAKRRSLISKRPPHTEQVYGQRELGDIPSLPEVNFAVPPYDHIMAPQDWDAVMNEFDLGTGASAMASFVEPYIPFDGRLP
ncbi:hypothetical protein CTAM01_15391 [Colletotrichum tamarilloi]|uniref:Fungal specific transcription factor n=1 Tax=Colletotrichum tamarilloi TaxID=1209934 RepID=A0ABQ9QLN8_9PEZI|nr:uncharacterized protein CTAM01_15391 [Colletotrichum tamarilloi]KAK1476663.1 hypothetical protein CTAM01_15391 [Colletotrichum tamarilloi]